MPDSPSARPAPHAHPGKEDRADAMHAITAIQPAQTGQSVRHHNTAAAHAKPPPGTAQAGDAMNRLLDAVKEHLHLGSDAALSSALGVAQPVISKLRHHRLRMSAMMLMRLHEATGWSIDELKRLLNLPDGEKPPRKTPAARAPKPDDPVNRLLDAVKEHLHLKSDAALSAALGIAPPVVSKLRHGRLEIWASMLIRLHDVTGWPIRELKHLLNLPAVSVKPPPEAAPAAPPADPENRLLDAVKQQLHLQSDAALAGALGVSPATVSNLRHHRVRLGLPMLMCMKRATGWSVHELKGMLQPDADAPPAMRLP